MGGGGENVYSLAHRADERQIPLSSHIGAKARIKVQTERERENCGGDNFINRNSQRVTQVNQRERRRERGLRGLVHYRDYLLELGVLSYG